MTKILLIGDCHLADRPPSIRTETYTEDILAKLAQSVSFAKKHHCDAIAQAGDIFHIKTATRNSHSLVQRTAEVLQSSGIPVWIVPGNHDLQSDRLDSLRKQPLGTLAKISGIDLLMGPHPELPVFGLPYLHDWETELPKWMHKYSKWVSEKMESNSDFKPLLVTHAPIFPAGDTPPYEHIPAANWAQSQKIGDCYYGHIHTPHGDYEEGGVNFCNNGAISRGSLHEETLKREPKVTVWSDEGPSRWTVLPLDFRPAEAVFRLQEKEDVDEKNSRVEEFLESVGTTTLDGLSLEEVVSQAKARGLSPTTQTLIESLLEEVSQ